jgi:RNA polymerase sigma-70 factor (ECF subfamily)
MDNELFLKIQANDEKAFEQLFKKYYTPLCRYAYTLLQDRIASEEVVQEVFFRIWLTRNKIQIRNTVAAYLLRAVKNQSLNQLAKKARSGTVSLETLPLADISYDPYEEEDQPDTDELQQKLVTALESLPVQCRKIFELSRFEKKKYKEIAKELNISVKTVEAQMGIAFKKLRSFVKFIITFIRIC